jgi:hypothetical protein
MTGSIHRLVRTLKERQCIAVKKNLDALRNTAFMLSFCSYHTINPILNSYVRRSAPLPLPSAFAHLECERAFVRWIIRGMYNAAAPPFYECIHD